jgi:hypothetical protein
MKHLMRNFGDRLVSKQAEIAERLMRALNIKGDLPDKLEPIFSLDVTTEDLTLPEFWYLRRGAYFDGGASPVATAAQYSFVSLGAPQLSPVLAVVEKVTIYNPDVVARTFNVGTTYTVTNPANAEQLPRESRDGFRRSAFCVAARTSATAQLTGNASYLAVVPAGGQVVVDGPWMLSAAKLSPAGPPGQLPQVTVQSENFNIAMRAHFVWRERFQQESEL